LLELVGVARRAGLRIGASETLDAQRAAAAVGLHDREDLRAALAATLVKREEDRAAFDRVFDGFFRPDAGGRRGALDRLRAEGASEETLSALLERLEVAQQAAGAGGGLAALMEGGVELDRRLEAAMRAAGVSRMQSPMQVGLYALRTLDELGADRMQRELEDVRGALIEEAGAAGERLADALAAQLEALRRQVRARVREDFERRNPERLARSRAARLEREALAVLDRDEVEQVTREVRRLGRLLRDRIERRRRRARRGRLDVRATVRASLRTGGVPFAPVFRRRRRERPKLVVLCDVSDSVRMAARFLLVLVHAMQEAFARTRSFVFVRDVGEATHLFEAHPVEEAVALAFGGEAVPVGASSDYGRVLGQVADRHRGAIDRRTTVVVLGDGRNNRQDPNVEALRQIAARAARVVWLNPEPRGSWGFGDSEMDRYAPFCTFTASVRSLGELRAAVERLAAVVGR
jgi:hypothetical protein